MNPIKLLFSIALLFNIAANAQRPDELPEISDDVYGVLTDAEGYSLNGSNWESAKNKIPVALEPEFESLKDFEIYGLGKDNFSSYELREITVGKWTEMLLIKRFRDGHYDEMEDHWFEHQYIAGYIFNKKLLSEIAATGEKGNETVAIPVICSFETSYPDPEMDTKLNLEKVIYHELKIDNRKNLALYIWIRRDVSKGKVSFYITGKKDGPKNQYFETSIKKFNNFLPQ